MNADAVLHAALVTALTGAADFGGAINGVFEGPAVKASTPYAEVGEMMASDWGTKDVAGREIRTTLFVRDRAERPARLHALAAAAESAIGGIGRDLDGWRIASLVALRTRIVREAPGSWTAIVEHRVRMLRAG